ncbi:MAG: hypothetical protein ACYC4L_19040, partial [Chloroflexota bacterium]
RGMLAGLLAGRGWWLVKVWWGLLIVLALLGQAVALSTAPAADPLPDVPLAATFVAWYGFDEATGECRGGLGSTHWNNSPNTGGVVYRPELGYYCSADPDVVAWQLDQVEAAGIEVLLVSWWGWGDWDLDGEVNSPLHADAYMNKGIEALLRDIKEKQRPLKIALIVEPFTLTQAPQPGIHPRDCPAPEGTTTCLLPEQKREVLDWLWRTYYRNPDNPDYADLMFEWEGKPLVLAFDPMTLPADERYTVRLWTGRARDDDAEREGWQWFFGPPQDPVEGMSDGVAWVYPRFDECPAKQMGADYITWKPRHIDPLLREGSYERQWQRLIENRAQVRLVVLYGWNLYGEQAHVEPSWGCPAPVGWRYLEKTAAYYQAFLAGGPLPALEGGPPGCAWLPLVRR